MKKIILSLLLSIFVILPVFAEKTVAPISVQAELQFISEANAEDRSDSEAQATDNEKKENEPAKEETPQETSQETPKETTQEVPKEESRETSKDAEQKPSAPPLSEDRNIDFAVHTPKGFLQFGKIVKKFNTGFHASFSEFSKSLGYEVQWDEKQKKATASKSGLIFSVSPDSRKVEIGRETFELKHPAVTYEGKIYLELSDMTQCFGMEYSYDETSSVLSIPFLEPDKSLLSVYPYTEEEVVQLAKLIDYEARGASLLKKIAVANVVLNRVKNPHFPNRIGDVIFAKNQFPPVRYKSYASKVPTASSLKAVRLALAGRMEAPDCLFFNYVPFRASYLVLYKNIEGDYFYTSTKH